MAQIVTRAKAHGMSREDASFRDIVLASSRASALLGRTLRIPCCSCVVPRGLPSRVRRWARSDGGLDRTYELGTVREGKGPAKRVNSALQGGARWPMGLYLGACSTGRLETPAYEIERDQRHERGAILNAAVLRRRPVGLTQ